MKGATGRSIPWVLWILWVMPLQAQTRIESLGGGVYRAVITVDSGSISPLDIAGVRRTDNSGTINYISISSPWAGYRGFFNAIYRFGWKLDGGRFRSMIPAEAVLDSVKIRFDVNIWSADGSDLTFYFGVIRDPWIVPPETLWNLLGGFSPQVVRTYGSLSMNDTLNLGFALQDFRDLHAGNLTTLLIGVRESVEFRSGDGDWYGLFPSGELWVYYRVPPVVDSVWPSAGDTLYEGAGLEAVAWKVHDADGYVDSVRVRVYRPGGSEIWGWKQNTGGANPWQDRVFLDLASLNPCGACYVGMWFWDDDGMVRDTVVGPFVIAPAPAPAVQIHWPNRPGIKVVEGKTYWIRYSAYTPEGVDSVTGWLSLDGGNTFADTIRTRGYSRQPDSVRNDSLRWVIDFPPSKTIRVKVEALSAGGRVGAAVSSHNIGYLLARPTSVQVQVVDSGLGLSWQDRSNYETRYMLKIRAFSWSGDTLEGAKYLTGTNGTSGFVAWDDPFWDFIPAGTAGVLNFQGTDFTILA